MRVLLAAVVAAGTLTLTASASTDPVTVAWPASGTLHVLFLGDSLSHGALASTPSRSFASLVTADLQRHGTTVAKIEGVGGKGVPYWLARTSVIPRNTDLAIIELGTNDINDTADYLAAARRWATEYERLEATIKSRAKHAQIVCLSVWGQQQIPTTHLYNTAISEDCDGPFVNIWPLSAKARLRGADNFHPNDAGHAAIAAAIMRVLRFAR